MALIAEAYAGIKTLEERRKDLNHERNGILERQAQDAARLAVVDAELLALVTDRDAALARAGVAAPDAASYLKFDDATKTVVLRTLAEDAAAKEAARDAAVEV